MFAVAIAGVLAGVYLSAVKSISRSLVGFSGGVLVGVAAFWVTPELARFFGWTIALAWVAAGFFGLWAMDRFVYPVCPSCSQTHDHDLCSARLHGFALPMLLVAGAHSFLDGWILAASGQEGARALSGGVLLAIGAHKLPEGVALGVIVRAALGHNRSALWSSILAEAMTLAGAGAEMILAPSPDTPWAHVLLGLAAGSFLYLGYHAVHSEYKRGGMSPVLIPALTGVAGSSAVRWMIGGF